MAVLKVKVNGVWVDIPTIKGNKGDKGDPGAIHMIPVTVLPSPSSADPSAIYLVPSPDPQQQDVMLEYIVYNGQWERLGATSSVSLDNYYTKTETNGLLSNKQDTVSDLSTIRSNASAGKTASDNLAGHTVAKDVPSNAVFTDTVYDDTALAGRVSTIEGKEAGWDAKYTKPSGGITASDLATVVQQSLDKADSALQSESDPVFVASAAHGITASDITNWNAKANKGVYFAPSSNLSSEVFDTILSHYNNGELCLLVIGPSTKLRLCHIVPFVSETLYAYDLYSLKPGIDGGMLFNYGYYYSLNKLTASLGWTKNTLITDPQFNGLSLDTAITSASSSIPLSSAVKAYVDGAVPSSSKQAEWDAKADTSDIPTALSELSDDSTHRLVTDAEKTTWNGKASANDIASAIAAHNTSTTAHEDIREIAAGKTTNYVCSSLTNPILDSTDDIITLTGDLIDIHGDTVDVDNLKEGDNIYVSELSVYDRWYAGNNKLYRLETAKVPVTDVQFKNGTVIVNGVAHIPSTLASFDDDSTHRLVTDTEKTTWNAKADTSDIPTALSGLTDDSTHRLVTDDEKAAWNGKSNVYIPSSYPSNLTSNDVDVVVSKSQSITTINGTKHGGEFAVGDILYIAPSFFRICTSNDSSFSYFKLYQGMQSYNSASINPISGKGVAAALSQAGIPSSSKQAEWDAKADASDIPTAVSDLTNDAGYLTLATLPVWDGGNE